MSKFLAIDFETANDHKLSACSVGIVLFDKKNINGKFESLIRPPTYYDHLWRTNYNIHGISKNVYMKARTFPQVWQSLQNKYSISNSTIVCHNAGFDMNILLELFLHYKISAPKFYYLDTINIAKLTWDSQNYRLSTLASRLKIPLNHHDALSDSLACAKIAMKSLNYHKEEDFNNILQGSRFGYGVLEKKKNTPMGKSRIRFIDYKEDTNNSVASISSKFCIECNKKKPIKDFRLDGRTSDGYSKSCIKNHHKKSKKIISNKVEEDINLKFEKIIEEGLNETKYSSNDTSKRVQKIMNEINVKNSSKEYMEKSKAVDEQIKKSETELSSQVETPPESHQGGVNKQNQKIEKGERSILKDIVFVYGLLISVVLIFSILR